jgi:hypothetical protein
LTIVVVELQQAWSARMWILLGKIEGKVVLLWFVGHAPDDTFPPDQEKDPWFVTREMIEELRSMPAELGKVTASPFSCALGTKGMVLAQCKHPSHSSSRDLQHIKMRRLHCRKF